MQKTKSPTLPAFALWLGVAAVCAALVHGSATLLLAGLLAPPALLVLWLLRRL